jgi:hypothetical protein
MTLSCLYYFRKYVGINPQRIYGADSYDALSTEAQNGHTYGWGRAETRYRTISTERHFYAHKIKKKVTTPFFFAAQPRRIFIHINWRYPYLWWHILYVKVLRGLGVPVHFALEQCPLAQNEETPRPRSVGGIFSRSERHKVPKA